MLFETIYNTDLKPCQSLDKRFITRKIRETSQLCTELVAQGPLTF